MRLENASINQWEQKCNSDGGSAVELTIRADVVKDDSYSTFCIHDVLRDFENYISQYKYGDRANRDRAEEELESVKKSLREWQQKYTSFRAKFRDIFDSFSYYESEDDIIARVKAVRDVREYTERHNTGLIKENGELKEKVKDLEEGLEANLEEQKEWRRRFLNMRNTLGGLIEGEYDGYLPDDKIISHFSNLVKSFKDLTDKKYELSNELDSEKKSLKKAQMERYKLEKDLMDVADILQVGGLRTINDILDKAHYWVHERSIDDEELKMILRMDLDSSREDILDRIEEVVKEASECKEAHAALMNVYNACLPAKMDLADDTTAKDISKEIVRVITNKEKLRNMDAVILGDFLSFRDKVKKMVGCESNECSEILDVLKAHLEDKKELSGKLEMYRRFRDDVITQLDIDGDWTIDEVLHEISRDVRLASKAEFICGYFDVKQDPLTSIAENICLEIKEKVISEYKAEVEAKRQDDIRDAAKKAGSVGNGVYLDGLTVEQNLRAENVRLKAEREKDKEYITKLEGSLDCIHCESAAALGYECE